MKRWQDIVLALLNKISNPNKVTHIEMEQYNETKNVDHMEVWCDPRVYTIASYEPPSPTTDGKLAAAQSPRYKDTLQSLQVQHDALIRHEIRMSQQHRRVQDTEPRTEIMPRIHKYHLSRFSGTYPGETEHRTPAFLRDRKVS